MAVLAVVAAATAIWLSVLGCKVTCCGRPATGVCLNSSVYCVPHTLCDLITVLRQFKHAIVIILYSVINLPRCVMKWNGRESNWWPEIASLMPSYYATITHLFICLYAVYTRVVMFDIQHSRHTKIYMLIRNHLREIANCLCCSWIVHDSWMCFRGGHAICTILNHNSTTASNDTSSEVPMF